MTEIEFYHKSQIDLLSQHFLENDWVWLYKFERSLCDGIDSFHYYFCYLSTPRKSLDALCTSSRDIEPEARVALTADLSYRNYIIEGFEHLTTVRSITFNNEHIKDIRLAEEIIYYHNLFEYKDSAGDSLFYQLKGATKTLVCVIKQDSVRILNRYLIEYIAAKKMDLVCCCQSEIEYNTNEISLPFNIKFTKNCAYEDITDLPNSNYRLCVAPFFSYIQSWFKGKIILRHPSLQKFILAMNPQISYIIGTDEYGNNIYSDENSNPYSMVFFDKSVLTLYANKQGCRIEPLRIKTPSFSLRCDNDNANYIVAFLKDILDLPYEDQCMWKGRNCPPDGRTFSDIFQCSVIRGNWKGVAVSVDFVFRDIFVDFMKHWRDRFGWTIFKPLNGVQSETLGRISLLHSEDYESLKSLVANLALLLQESINESVLSSIVRKRVEFIKCKYQGQDYTRLKTESNISHLSSVCESVGIDASLLNEFLQHLQTLRSYVLHRNSETPEPYQTKAMQFFGFNKSSSNTIEVSHNILSKGIAAFREMLKQLQ